MFAVFVIRGRSVIQGGAATRISDPTQEPERAEVALARPVISGVVNGNIGQLLVTGGRDPNAACYEMRCAVGGSTGYSDWSDPVSHMSM